MGNAGSPERRVEGECFAGRVRSVSRVATRTHDDVPFHTGAPVSPMDVYPAVVIRGLVSASEICRERRLDKSALSREFDRLHGKGGRSTQGAGRSRSLEVTVRRRALIRAVLPAWDVAQDRVRRCLGGVTEVVLEAVTASNGACHG